jgi:D-beta-D-heptose 7-phosphate kinase/D-beta-D-heptose 1-phosphate adenosyltransferase
VADLLSLIDRFAGTPLLVVGDLMLDEFVWGTVSRISPEAPVPVLEVQRRTFAVGGAANTAANAQALGGRAAVAGLVGDDAAGGRVRELLGDLAAGVVDDATRPTTVKTRVVAGTQQVVRIDHEQPGPPPPAAAAALATAITRLGTGGVVVSDYGKGVVTAELARTAILIGKPVVIDPKGIDYARYRGATLVKPNQLEAGQVLNRTLRTDADVLKAGLDLVELLGGATSVLITRGPSGMTAFEPGRPPVHVPAQAREVYDVTGAGDTVAATLTLALTAGADLEAACRLASLAAAVVVGKAGTAVCTAAELADAVRLARW